MKRFFIYAILISTLAASSLFAREFKRIGKWEITTTIDPIYDIEQININLLSNTSEGVYGSQNDVYLSIFYLGNKDKQMIFIGVLSETNINSDMIIRYDKEVPINVNTHKINEIACFLDTKYVLEKLQSTNVLVVRGTTASGGVFTYTFDTAKLAEVLSYANIDLDNITEISADIRAF